MPKIDADAYLCDECSAVHMPDDVDADDAIYECGDCGEVFRRSESEYDSHRCSCGKFAAKLADFGCPECNAELVPLFRGGVLTVADYPEHEKLAAVKDKSQAIGDFLDWALQEHGAWLMVGDGDAGVRSLPKPIIDLLADFFGIDLDVIEAEKRAMLDEMRAVQEAADRDAAESQRAMVADTEQTIEDQRGR